jgi:hypothetical protein
MSTRERRRTPFRSASWLGPLLAIALLAPPANPAAERAPAVAFRQEADRLSITVGGRPFATYVYRDPVIPRPYFAHVQTPCGIQATRNHPPRADDPDDHATFHPGIWLSFGDVDGNDYWRLKARVEHEAFASRPAGGPGRGTFAVRNAYRKAGGREQVCAELARYTILVRPYGTLLVWRSTFSSDRAGFTFGDQEELGLGMRVNSKISVEHGKGRITDAAGRTNGKGVWGRASDWVDYSGPIGDRRVGMALMPDPANFRPSWFHARDYGLVVANPFGRYAMTGGARSVVAVRQGEQFSLGFGILVYCTPVGVATDVEAAYRDYVNLVRELDR